MRYQFKLVLCLFLIPTEEAIFWQKIVLVCAGVFWLRFIILFQNHEITGDVLLTLSDEDLQQSPFNISDQNEREHLYLCIEMLKKAQIAKYMKKLDRNVSVLIILCCT